MRSIFGRPSARRRASRSPAAACVLYCERSACASSVRRHASTSAGRHMSASGDRPSVCGQWRGLDAPVPRWSNRTTARRSRWNLSSVVGERAALTVPGTPGPPSSQITVACSGPRPVMRQNHDVFNAGPCGPAWSAPPREPQGVRTAPPPSRPEPRRERAKGPPQAGARRLTPARRITRLRRPTPAIAKTFVSGGETLPLGLDGHLLGVGDVVIEVGQQGPPGDRHRR